MKRIISAILALTLLAALSACGKNASDNVNNLVFSNKYNTEDIKKDVSGANTKFAFNIFKKLNDGDKGKNVFISPLSISTALAMTYNGAGSTTAEGMAKALGFSGMSLEDVNESFRNLIAYLNNVDNKVELNINNSIWIKEGEKIKQDFIERNKISFNADVRELDFLKDNAADTINKWISDATKKKIEKMIDPPISGDVIMYLINAIYFKSDWKVQFDEKKTFDGLFRSENGETSDVKMMSRKGTVDYTKNDEYQAVRLPYGKGSIAMYCILPNENTSIDSFIDGLDSDKWSNIRSSLSETEDLNLQLPRFKMEYGIKELNDSLISLGMHEAFSHSADFTGIRENIFISRVLHKAVIEVNEQGSEAAGVTVVEMKLTAVMEPLEFIADRPFVFMIADEETGSILFIGKLCDII